MHGSLPPLIVSLLRPSNGHELAVLQRKNRAVKTRQFAPPPRSRPSALRRVGEVVFINERADVSRGRAGERIRRKQLRGGMRSFEQSPAALEEPWVVPEVAQGSEPHLPIQPGLVRRDERRRA